MLLLICISKKDNKLGSKYLHGIYANCSGQLLLAEQITRIHPDKHLIRKNILQTSNLCVSE